MALGVNAHVNNDLPLVLQGCQLGNEYKSDFKKINTVIAQQLHDVFNSLHETDLLFRLLIQLQIIFFPLLSATIGNWRAAAWNNYEKLLAGETNKNKIEHEAWLGSQFLLKLS